MARFVVVWMAAAALGACSLYFDGDDRCRTAKCASPPSDHDAAPPSPIDAPPVRLGLCDVCGDDSDCASGICKMYGDGYRKCTLACDPTQPAPQCEAPSQGACNGMGVCMCERIDPPSDAGVDGGGPMDAATGFLDAI